MNNRTEGELILAHRRGIECIREQRIEAIHQVLDNNISKAYKRKFLNQKWRSNWCPPTTTVAT